MSIKTNENPQRCTAREITEIIKEYLNTDFCYKNLQNKKERKIYQSGFWAGSQFRQDFDRKRQSEFKEGGSRV